MRPAWAIGSLLLVAACGTPTPPAGERPLSGQVFLSTAVTVAGKPHALVPNTQVSLDFTDDGRLLATAGCNTMSGPVRTDAGRLRVDDLAVTEMGCDPRRHAQDEWLARILGAGPAWLRHGPTLTITAGDTELVLTRRADRALENTTWTVDTILDGQTASSTPAGETATITFDGRQARIHTGCNGAVADYTTTGDTIRFGEVVHTDMMCAPGIMRVESAVYDVVHGEITIELDGDRLTLTHPSGKGIQLHAR
ncbi:MAG TPA: META domain-containing protein [Actinophytocola sp.]|uniref:META domain-containing protein n=1 Tax=Actinophytocola sp. TaxID=1872138 RepID=UPI002F94E659